MKRFTTSAIRAIAVRLVAVTCLTAGISGCAANAQMTDVWHDPMVKSASYHHVLVVAIRRDPVRRRAWEDAYVAGLAARGVNAVSSYRDFPAAPPDTQDVIDAVRKQGYDAVLTSIRQPDEATSRYVPGAIRQEYVEGRGSRYGRYHDYWITVQDPGYTESDTIIRIQTDLWSTAGADHMVWSGTLSTLESAQGRSPTSSVEKQILPEMERQGMVPKPTR